MTNKLNITPEAERDIFAISANIMQQDGVQSAKHAISAFKHQLNILAEFPESGRAVGGGNTREIVMTGLPYIAIYEKTCTSIIIVRVLYGADDRSENKEIK